MSELEEKLSGILNDPKMMQQIMGMAQMLSGAQPQEEKKEPPPPSEPAGGLGGGLGIDLGMLQSIAGLLQKSGIDRNQQSLLKALQPYLSRDRIIRLERAMHAARMASSASLFLNQGGLTRR